MPLDTHFKMISFGREICGNFQLASRKEWIISNGIGGYASSTIIGCNTRRYHGLLISALSPPVGRTVLLSKVEENLIIDDNVYPLSTNSYGSGLIHPNGFNFQQGFHLDPYPTFTYFIEGFVLQKKVLLIYDENTVVLTYKILNPQCNRKVILEIRPLINYRDYHSETKENSYFNLKPEVSSLQNNIFLKFQPYQSVEPFFLYSRDAEFHYSPSWYRNFFYEREKERGLYCNEDLASPGYFIFNFKEGTVGIICSSEKLKDEYIDVLRSKKFKNFDDIFESQKKKLYHRCRISENDSDFIKSLLVSADSFIVSRKMKVGFGKTILAGYHWFEDWGRDVMISLPGLTLAIGKYREAEDILVTFCKYIDYGMVPNRLGDENTPPAYNSVDATLWFFYAVWKYLQYTKNYEFVASNLLDKLMECIYYYNNGTRYNIHRDPQDGLLDCGDEGSQLTWMDAKVGDWVVTPRYGKPVEINALWFNALKILENILFKISNNSKLKVVLNKISATEHYIPLKNISLLAKQVKENFEMVYWNDEKQCLYDCVRENLKDSSVRPNQIFSISLPFQLLSNEKAKKMLEVVKSELLTTFGLRTLSPYDEKFRGYYSGSQLERDSAYHQGTVWAWLIGHFISAYLKIYGKNEEILSYVKEIILPFKSHIFEYGVGSISEIFEGSTPHNSVGCISQAWSVAEVIRILKEELKMI